ncbi:MAG: L,D-transpeptidase family protein [Geminicoccaceae bacterium]
MTMDKEVLPPAQRTPTLAMCLVGVWFSSGCNLDTLIDQEGSLRETLSYRTVYEDTLLDLARQFKLGYVEMVAANPGTDPWVPGEGTDVILPTVHLIPDLGEAKPEGLVINLADMRLYFFEENSLAPRSFPIGIGRDGLNTPTGTTKIVGKRKDPSWHPTARMREEDPELPKIVPAGPENPLGSRAMYLGWPQYLIHGTNKPWGVGRRVSSGCVRMYPEDVETLFELVRVDTKVTVIDQPIKLGWIGNELFMEAHPTQQQSDQLEAMGRFEPRLDSQIVEQVLASAGEGRRGRLDWGQIRKVTIERRGYPIQITR